MRRHLGRTNIKTVVLEEDTGCYRVLATASDPTHAHQGPEAVVGRLVALGRRAIAEHGPVATAGIGVPGLFDRDRGTVVLFPNLPGPWPGHPLRDPVAAGLGVPVQVINDARAFTLAEVRLGAGRGCDTLVCLTLGTGVGGGLMVGGRLHLGAWGVAGEVGHQTVLPDGPQCGCGNRGCVEALARADALASLAGRSSPDEVFAGLRAGDERCLAAVRRVACYLGIAIANLITVLGPDRVVIGGGIASAGEVLLEEIRAAVRARVTLVPAAEIQVVAAALGPQAGAVGAAVAGAEGA